MTRPNLSSIPANDPKRTALEAEILKNQEEIIIQKKLHKGLEPHLAALTDDQKKTIAYAVQQSQAANGKKFNDAKRMTQQKATPQSKKAANARPPTQPKTTPASRAALQARATASPSTTPTGRSSPAPSPGEIVASASKKKKPSAVKVGPGKIAHLIKAMPADKQAGTKVMTKKKLQQLVAQIAPHEKLDEDVEDILLDIADDFIESVTDFACILARHRNSKILEVKDIQLHLERNWNMRLPGFGHDHIHPVRKPAAEIHKQRLIAVKKAQMGAEKK